MNMNYDYVTKIILVGNTNAGKSVLMTRYATNDYVDDKESTIGVDFSIKYIRSSNINVKI